MSTLVEDPTRILFFTGKGGVGKTSSACATAIALADAGNRVLLVSTDPASNLDEVLGVALSGTVTQVPDVENLAALNIDPEQTARDYRERVVGPYRGVLPDAAIASMEEQLSGACTVEIAALDEFSKLLGSETATVAFDHVIFDTAPTGHTLRLLELPAAWTDFIDANVGGTSCLGPLSGLSAQKELYARSNEALRDPVRTTLVIVARPEPSSLAEAERTRAELAELGVTNVRLILNGVFRARDANDPTAVAMEARGRASLEALPVGLADVPRVQIPLLPFELVGVEMLRRMGRQEEEAGAAISFSGPMHTVEWDGLDTLVHDLARSRRGVVMTMGKGGVGKTTLAARIAMGLARRGLPVTLTITDPAAHVEQAVEDLGVAGSHLRVSRIDPKLETERYTQEVLRTAGEAYHREVLRQPSGSSDGVQQLLPRLRDGDFTHVLLVTLPEATPIHEAMELERDLARASIKPYGWVVNQSLTPLSVTDPVLRLRQAAERVHLEELAGHATRVVLEPWMAGGPEEGVGASVGTLTGAFETSPLT
ncbi:MAG: TRC40/GET3/ArsA family transport-energizing ATPase [Gemmatimonadota bacterium]